MYPAVSRKDALAYLSGRHDGTLVSNDLQASFREDAKDWVDPVTQTLEDVIAAWNAVDLTEQTSDRSRDAVEGQLAAILHDGLSSLPATVLTDKDFWRYCACYLHDFVVWRQPSATVSALLPYFGISSESLGVECVPHRMFDRAFIASAGAPAAPGDDQYALARFGASDVWKSHILRTRNSYAPVVVHEMLKDVAAGKLPTDKVRALAKNLKRIRSNVLFEVLDAPQARVLIDRETARAADALSTALDSEGAN